MKNYKMFVDGKWVDSASKETFDVLNPYTEKVIAKVPSGNSEDAKKAIKAARKSFDSGVWSRITPSQRQAVLLKLADLVEKNLKRLARLESENQGKTIKYATESDFPFIVDTFRFFAGAARILDGIAAYTKLTWR